MSRPCASLNGCVILKLLSVERVLYHQYPMRITACKYLNGCNDPLRDINSSK